MLCGVFFLIIYLFGRDRASMSREKGEGDSPPSREPDVDSISGP